MDGLADRGHAPGCGRGSGRYPAYQPTLFSDIFQSAIDRVRETDAAKNEVAYQLATGQLDNPAALMTSITEAQASLELLIQLRNKAVESYNELMRLSV